MMLFVPLVILLAIMVPAAGIAQPVSFYVSPRGSDSWSGTLASPNRSRDDGPFATIARARDAVREVMRSQQKPEAVTVHLRGGAYYIDQPLVLTPEDSGTAECPVTYRSYGREQAIISGGTPLTGTWTRAEVDDGRLLWTLDIPEAKGGQWYFRQLSANDRRLSRARLPKEGFYQFGSLVDAPADVPWNEGQDRVHYNENDIRPWRNLSDVEVTALHFWVDSHLPIASVDEASKVVTFGKKSVFRMTEGFSATGVRYFVENVFEALDEPGQWYLDRKPGRLYFVARPGEDPNKMVFVAPRLSQLVKLEGNAGSGKPIENVRFEGITFTHTEWTLPADRSGSSQAAHHVPAVFSISGCHECAVTRCTFTRIGNYGIDVLAGCEDVEITRNMITDMGAGGVRVHPGSTRTLVANNEIGDGGKLFQSAVGVWIGNTGHNKVLHNNIHDLYYTGVSVGWTWGYHSTQSVENEIAYNHIYNIGRGWLSDMGGIYHLGPAPGTVLHSNLIHHIESASYGGWGIYLDEGSTNVLVRDNLVYRTKFAGFNQHYGKNNLIQNNIFAFAREQAVSRGRVEPHRSFRFERNIVYYDSGTLLGGSFEGEGFKFDSNLYYDASGRPVTFAGVSFEDWQKRGQDIHSGIADPMFVDAANYDFRLRPGSPAIQIGFIPFDLSTAGVEPEGRPGATTW